MELSGLSVPSSGYMMDMVDTSVLTTCVTTSTSSSSKTSTFPVSQSRQSRMGSLRLKNYSWSMQRIRALKSVKLTGVDHALLWHSSLMTCVTLETREIVGHV